MKNKKIYIIIIIVIIVMLLLVKMMVNVALKANQETEDFEIIEETDRDTLVGKQAEKVKGYHLVTYNQSANMNSYLKNLEVQVESEGKVKFVIGSVNEQSIVEERNSFELECKQGENSFDLSEKKYGLKKGEYLFMDIAGQDTLYKQEGNSIQSLVQTESNQRLGEMILVESDYDLPFHYTLEKVKTYNCFVIGNDLTTSQNAQGLDATDNEHDYYYLTKTRFENIFEKVNMERVSLTNWEKGVETAIGNDILPKDDLENLDLVLVQLGENFDTTSDFETKIVNLIKYIKQYSPNAEIVWLNGWNTKEVVLNKIPAICEQYHVELISIEDLYNQEYQSLVTELSNPEAGELVYYPNNEGMQVISNRIMEKLKFDF